MTCLLFPYTEVAHNDIRMQRPTNYAWLRMPQYMGQMVDNPTKRELKHYELEETIKE